MTSWIIHRRSTAARMSITLSASHNGQRAPEGEREGERSEW